MKLARYVLYLLAFTLCSCAKEKEFPNAHTYPFLKILHATADNTGIKVTAEISTPGTAEVKEYGFAYHPTTAPQKEVRIKVSVAGNKIETLLTEQFAKQNIYQISAYAIVNNKIVYSPAVHLKSIISSQPVITDFFPKEGASNSEVTITGTSFTDDKYRDLQVYIGNKGVTVLSAAYHKLVIRVPEGNFFGAYPIRVVVRGVEGTSAEPFTILGPEIEGMTKYEGLPGDTVALFGKNLMAGWGTFVRANNLLFKVISASDTELKLEVPLGIPGQFEIPAPVVVQVGEKIAVSTFVFTIRSNFNALASYNQVSQSNYMPAFEADGKGYFFDNNRVVSYSAATGSWLEESKFPGTARTNPVWERVGDKAYLLGGVDGVRTFGDVWEYDFRAGTWLQRSGVHFTFYSASSFVLEGKIYFAGGLNSINRYTLWRYDPVLQNITVLKSLPIDIVYGMTYTRNGKAYVINKQSILVYNSASDTWQVEPQQSPGFGYAFTTNDKALYLLTRESTPILYHYQEAANSWEKVAFYPGCFVDPRDIIFSGFTAGDALFVGSFKSGVNLINCHNRFYSYQP